jgi:KamA family protein
LTRKVDRSAVLKPPLIPAEQATPPRFKAYSESTLDKIPQLDMVTPAQRFAMHVIAKVLPFRVNQYVVDELIDWTNVPHDPIFQLTFPQRDMLAPEHFDRIAGLVAADADKIAIRQAVSEIRRDLNPHPAGQQKLNAPMLDGTPLEGVQHKYPETVLFFPAQGQTCHSYCTFCFRWAQFIGDKDLKFASSEAGRLVAYLQHHQEVTYVLITGGDPMVMKTKNILAYAEALLEPGLEHIQNIRFGSKALTFWPYRFVSDKDADDLLRVFDMLVANGKHVAFMAHFNHWRELEPEICHRAIRRIRDTGVVIRAQGPLLAHINDDAQSWARMWHEQVRLGVIPYYMFVERDTGARRYFELPLARAYNIYRDAMRSVSGLGRTARGPSMSAGPGKVEIQGITEIAGEKVFALRFIQARNPDWVQQPFFARYDDKATWLDHLRPAFGDERFFFEEEYRSVYGATTLK